MGQWPYCILDKGQASYNPKQKRPFVMSQFSPMERTDMKDRHGNIVELGDVVRVVEICQEFLDLLPGDELAHIVNMLDQTYAIDDFPEPNKASVSISWEIGPGLTGHGGLYMLANEFELVHKASAAQH